MIYNWKRDILCSCTATDVSQSDSDRDKTVDVLIEDEDIVDEYSAMKSEKNSVDVEPLDAEMAAKMTMALFCESVATFYANNLHPLRPFQGDAAC